MRSTITGGGAGKAAETAMSMKSRQSHASLASGDLKLSYKSTAYRIQQLVDRFEVPFSV